MKRRQLLGAAVVAALPWRRLRAEPLRSEPGWRAFEVTTRAEISRPEGVSRAWLPLPLSTATDWQRTLGNTWNGNAKRMEEVRVGKYGVSMLYAEWAAGTEAPFVELKSKFSTRDRAVDMTRKAGASLSAAEVALYTAPTESKASGLYMICTLSKQHAESRGYDDALRLHPGQQLALGTE